MLIDHRSVPYQTPRLIAYRQATARMEYQCRRLDLTLDGRWRIALASISVLAVLIELGGFEGLVAVCGAGAVAVAHASPLFTRTLRMTRFRLERILWHDRMPIDPFAIRRVDGFYFMVPMPEELKLIAKWGTRTFVNVGYDRAAHQQQLQTIVDARPDSLVVGWRQGKMFASVCVLPLTEDFTQRFISGRESDIHINADDILSTSPRVLVQAITPRSVLHVRRDRH